MLRAINRAISLLSQLCFILSAAALFVIAAYGAADVAVAVAGGGGLPVTREASSVLLAAAVFLSFGYSQYRRQDIRVDVLIELCPSRVQRLSLLLSLILGIFVFAVLTWQSWELFLRSWRVGETAVALVRFPIYPAKLALALGSLAATLELTRQLVIFFCGRAAEPTGAGESSDATAGTRAGLKDI
ncbi:TRAP transporter small permease [Hyphomicrobium sp. CS1BSMeth3]|uniref:TRAP transporter small permease n=1 Tax=Hyphomicrobium sp. CS1BSMeth3 TaxID=1892844 RepID=UPI0009302BE3|nr:TRAP transporter small permease [Hyphomicrobium sp. CS1BSMeth3]